MPRGKRIRTLAALIAASDAKKCVVMTSHFTNRHMPATFMANMSGSVLHRMMIQGMFIYKPKEV
jgi:DNA-binding NarL/FixJ family response regulator